MEHFLRDGCRKVSRAIVGWMWAVVAVDISFEGSRAGASKSGKQLSPPPSHAGVPHASIREEAQ